MFADDVVMSDPKTTPENLAQRIEGIEKRIEVATWIGIAALAVALIVASGHGSGA